MLNAGLLNIITGSFFKFLHPNFQICMASSSVAPCVICVTYRHGILYLALFLALIFLYLSLSTITASSLRPSLWYLLFKAESACNLDHGLSFTSLSVAISLSSSSKKVADKFSVTFVNKTGAALLSVGSSDLYVFTNGINGTGPMGFQPATTWKDPSHAEF